MMLTVTMGMVCPAHPPPMGPPCLQLPAPPACAKTTQSRVPCAPPAQQEDPAGAWGRDWDHKHLGHLRDEDAGHMVVKVPAVMKGSSQLQLLSSTGELAFPKSTYVFKPFIFCSTESLNISASVLLFLLCVGAEGIYLMSQSGNAGTEEVLDCLTRQAEPGMVLPVTSF